MKKKFKFAEPPHSLMVHNPKKHIYERVLLTRAQCIEWMLGGYKIRPCPYDDEDAVLDFINSCRAEIYRTHPTFQIA